MSGKVHPLLEEALEAHGGHDRWRKVKGSTGGRVWELKDAPLILAPRRVTSEFYRQ